MSRSQRPTPTNNTLHLLGLAGRGLAAGIVALIIVAVFASSRAAGAPSQHQSFAGRPVRPDWHQGCSDAGHACFNPYEYLIGSASADRLTARWVTAVGATGEGAPLYTNGLLYVGTVDGVAGVDPATGAIVINFRTGSPVRTTPAIVRGFDPQPDPPGRLVVASEDATLSAFDTAFGRVQWQVRLGAEPTSPLVIQGMIIHGNDSTPDKVLVGAGNTLSAFDANGTRLWVTRLEGGDISRAGAVMIDQTDELVAVPAGDTLYALDATTGAVVWSATPGRSRLGAASVADPDRIGDPSAIAGPHIMIGDNDGNLYSIDPSTGATLATFAAEGPITASPAIGDPDSAHPWLFVGDGAGDIYAFDQIDEFPPPVWGAALGGPIDGPPVLANKVLYAATNPIGGDSQLFALDAATGATLFTTRLASGSATAPTVADGMVVIGIATGDLLAYDGPDS